MPLDADKLNALAAEVRAHADVYRSAVALASMLELLAPYEEAEARARAGAEEARRDEEAARLAADEARRAKVATERERDRAAAQMEKELDALEKQQQEEIDRRLAVQKGELRATEAALTAAKAQLLEVNARLDKIREVLQ